MGDIVIPANESPSDILTIDHTGSVTEEQFINLEKAGAKKLGRPLNLENKSNTECEKRKIWFR